MNVSTRPGTPGPSSEHELSDATIKAAAGWIAQFARTLKTCRLYDPANPTVVRFRAELAAATTRLLSDQGALTFQFRSDDVLMDGRSLYPARSRDDNLAYPFHRDGVRAITLQPGLDDREVGALLDAVLAVTGQNLDDDDLVTLLWECNFRHLDIDYIPAEGDVGGDGGPTSGGEGEGGGPLLPWPTVDVASSPGEAGAGDATAKLMCQASRYLAEQSQAFGLADRLLELGEPLGHLVD